MKTAAQNRKHHRFMFFFGEKNVLRFDLNQSREGFCQRLPGFCNFDLHDSTGGNLIGVLVPVNLE